MLDFSGSNEALLANGELVACGLTEHAPVDNRGGVRKLFSMWSGFVDRENFFRKHYQE